MMLRTRWRINNSEKKGDSKIKYSETFTLCCLYLATPRIDTSINRILYNILTDPANLVFYIHI